MCSLSEAFVWAFRQSERKRNNNFYSLQKQRAQTLAYYGEHFRAITHRHIPFLLFAYIYSIYIYLYINFRICFCKHQHTTKAAINPSWDRERDNALLYRIRLLVVFVGQENKHARQAGNGVFVHRRVSVCMCSVHAVINNKRIKPCEQFRQYNIAFCNFPNMKKTASLECSNYLENVKFLKNYQQENQPEAP